MVHLYHFSRFHIYVLIYNKIFILAHDKYVGKQLLSCAAGGGRYKLVQLLLEDNLTPAIELSNVYMC